MVDAPVWQPDGKTLVFCELSPDDSQSTIETIREDGSSRTSLTTTSTAVRWATSSYDGKQIVYTTFGATFGVSVLDVASLTSTPLVPDDASTMFGWPSFTPDDSGVVYVATNRATLDTAVQRIDLATHAITILFAGTTAHDLLNSDIYLGAD